MDRQIEEHYGSEDLEERIRKALMLAGKDPDLLELKDISVIDQLHTGGHLATQELAEKAGISPKEKILDAGCGIGGSSRLLGKKFNASVTGLDLVESFVSVAKMLTRATGLEENVCFQQGDLASLPFGENEFDIIWCQHTLMNIADKKSVLKQFARVLKKGGKLVLHEVVQGKGRKIHLPVPWADSSSISFLETAEDLGSMLSDSGFAPDFVSDTTDQAKLWWQKVKSAALKNGTIPRPLGPHIIFGKNGSAFGETMTANLDEDCIRLMEAVMVKV